MAASLQPKLVLTGPKAARFIAAGLGTGWLPVAPGSWGSLAALLLGWWIAREAGVLGLIVAILLLLPVACWSCRVVLVELEETDPGWIVVDEWLGQWLCLAMAASVGELSPAWLAAAFLSFRILDIAKPWPISAVEKIGPAWWSIQADDLLAGLIAGAMLMGAALWL